MTPTERQAEFKRLFESIPGKNTDRIKRVCEVLEIKPNTVRIYRCAEPTRTPPERSIKLLRRALEPTA